MKNVFTIDTEDWYHANYEEGLFKNDDSLISTVEANVDQYLALFDKYNVKATFFVLGCLVDKHSEMIKKIYRNGHEIASHGFGHHLVYKQTPDEFREDVRKSKILLEDVIGEKVIGYRAPSWSITEQSLWALEILEEEGFSYTSSIFPTKNFLYGIPYAPRFKHDCSIYGREDLKIINLPPTTKKTMNFKMGIPFSGGAYFRLLPACMIQNFTKTINRKEKESVIFYLHPREIDPKQPRLKLHFNEALIHYYGISGCEKKLIYVLKKNQFCTMKELLNL